MFSTGIIYRFVPPKDISQIFFTDLDQNLDQKISFVNRLPIWTKRYPVRKESLTDLDRVSSIFLPVSKSVTFLIQMVKTKAKFLGYTQRGAMGDGRRRRRRPTATDLPPAAPPHTLPRMGVCAPRYRSASAVPHALGATRCPGLRWSAQIALPLRRRACPSPQRPVTAPPHYISPPGKTVIYRSTKKGPLLLNTRL